MGIRFKDLEDLEYSSVPNNRHRQLNKPGPGSLKIVENFGKVKASV